MELSPLSNMQTSQSRKRKRKRSKRKKNSQNSSSQLLSNPSVNTIATVTDIEHTTTSLRGTSKGAALMESRIDCATGRVEDLSESDKLKKLCKGSPLIARLGGSLENTGEVSSLQKNKSMKKKKENRVSDFSLDGSIMKADTTVKVSCNESLASVTTGLEGSLESTRKVQKKKSTEKKKENKVSDIPLGNSFMNTDADIKDSCKESLAPLVTNLVGSLETTRRVSSLQKKKNTKKKKEEDKVPDFPLDTSIMKIDASTKDSCNESADVTNLESSKMNGDASLTKKKKMKKGQMALNIEKKRKKRKKAMRNNIEDNVNGSELPQDTFSSENSLLALDKPPKHSVQCLSMNPVMRESCAEKTLCEHVSSIPSSVVADKKESLLEVVKLNAVPGINDSSPKPEDKNSSAKNENLVEKRDGYPVHNHVSHKGKKLKTYSRRTGVNTDHFTVGSVDKLETEVLRDHVTSNREAATEEMRLITKDTCEQGPVTDVSVLDIPELQHEEKNDKKLDSKLDAGPDISAPVDAVDLSLICKKDHHSISFSSLNRTVSRRLKKLIVLDVNGLLADFVDFNPRRRRPDLRLNMKSVFKRPYVDDFLQFCFAKFHVGVWSSRTKKNLDVVIEFLMGKSQSKLLFCWNQSHCTSTKFRTLGYRKKPLMLKDIRKLWEKFDPDLPWEKGEFNESNTLLLDDSPYKALLNPMNTAIFPYSYSFRDRRDKSLGPGGDLRVYLEGLAMAENVQEYVASNPFGKRAITESSPCWGYYRKVIDSCKCY